MSEGTIVGLDNLNDYYDPTLKEYRLAEIAKVAEKSDVKYEFVKGDLADKALIDGLFEKYHFDVVVNLGFTPKITLREGLRAFAQWYKAFYCK